MKVAALPVDIVLGDKHANIGNAAAMLAQLPDNVALAVLPELFSTGFTRSRDKLCSWAETDEGPTMHQVRQWAHQGNRAIAGSFLCRGDEDGMFFNRAFLTLPDATTVWYDKVHTFSHSGENYVIASGCCPAPIIEWQGWRIRLIVCYDLRFPVFCRNKDMDYDMMVVPANWPVSRSQAWLTLLRARAIENQTAVVGANRAGADKFGEYPVEMLRMYNFYGDDLTCSLPNGIAIAEFNLEEQSRFRRDFPVYDDSDPYTLHQR